MIEAGMAIVSCPSCQALFRHAGSVEPARARGRCSRCGSVFALSAPAPRYRLVELRRGAPPEAAVTSPVVGAAPVSVAREIRIGLDDPALAERVRESGLEVRPGQPRWALTYQVVAADASAGEGETPTEPSPARVEPLTAPETAILDEPRHDPADAGVPEPRSRRLGEFARGLASGGWIGVGAVAGVLLSPVVPVDPRISASMGAAAGLLVALGSLRWMARRR
jgi:hypothetical protein